MPPKKSKSAATAPSPSSKKRKAEEDANALLFYQQLQQKEREKKQQGAVEQPLKGAVQRKSMSAALPKRKATAKSSHRKTMAAAPIPPPPPRQEEMQEEDEDEMAPPPPPPKRRRMNPPTAAAKDPDHERAKQWYQQQFVMEKPKTPPPPATWTPPPPPERRPTATCSPASSFVEPPPPARVPRAKAPPKAPFGSPLPTLPSNSAAARPTQTKLHSPPPSLPTVSELNALPSSRTAVVLSPSYALRETVSRPLPPLPPPYYDEPRRWNHVPPVEEPPPPPAVVLERQPEEEEKEKVRRRYRLFQTDTFVAVLAFLSVVLASVLMALFLDPSLEWPTTPGTHPDLPPPRPCFEDYPVRSNLELEEEALLLLGGSPSCEPTAPCPAGGHCAGGLLQHCYDEAHFRVADDGTACTFTVEAQRQRDALHDLLAKYTVQYHCAAAAASPNPFSVAGDGPSPRFDYRALMDVLQLPYHPKLVSPVGAKNEEMFVLERNEKDGSLSVGLHPSQVVELPLRCWLQQRAMVGLSTLMVWFWTLSVAFASWILSLYLAHPLLCSAISIFTFASWFLLRQVQHQRRTLRQVETEVVALREGVYEELSRDPAVAVPAALVGERLAWTQYPRSSAARQRLLQGLWPLVVRDIDTDGRIRKSWASGAVAGKPELYWQWVDPHPHSQVKKKEQ